MPEPGRSGKRPIARGTASVPGRRSEQRVVADTSNFAENGFVFLEGIVSPEELGEIEDWLNANHGFAGEEAVRTSAGELQAVYGLHRLVPQSLAVLRNPRVQRTIAELLGESVYLYQSQLHLKPSSSTPLEWHQDYRTYREIDGLPRPDGLVIGTFLDSISTDMAPVELVRGSHAKALLVSELSVGVPDTGPSAIGKPQGGGQKKYGVPVSILEQETAYPETEVLVGAHGSVFFLHPCLVHRSATNRTGRRRAIFYTNVFVCGNTPRSSRRPECVVARNFDPVW